MKKNRGFKTPGKNDFKTTQKKNPAKAPRCPPPKVGGGKNQGGPFWDQQNFSIKFLNCFPRQKPLAPPMGAIGNQNEFPNFKNKPFKTR